VHKQGVPYSGSYAVEFEGEMIVKGSRNPECDAARALLARGITGKLTMLDANTGKSRTIINIEKAAKLTVREDRRQGPCFVKWQPMPENAFERDDGRSLTAEEDAALPTMPPEANEAA
jgi:hypothetical protein